MIEEFTIGQTGEQITQNSTVHVENEEDHTVFTGSPHILRNIIWYVADVVWPGWYEHKKGRSVYLKYADECKDSVLKIADKGYLDKAWSKVRAKLEIDGVAIEVKG